MLCKLDIVIYTVHAHVVICDQDFSRMSPSAYIPSMNFVNGWIYIHDRTPRKLWLQAFMAVFGVGGK